MKDALDSRRFWEDRLRTNPNLRGTGHRSFDLTYNKWLYQAQWDCLDQLLEKHKIKLAGRSVLDVGSGTGFYIKYYAEHGAVPIFGMDITETSAQYLRKYYPSSFFLTCDVAGNALPLRRGFHLISAMSILYHIIEDSRFERSLHNLCQQLEGGGYLLLTDTFSRSLLPTAGHARFRTLDMYRSVFAQHEISIIEMMPIYYLLNRAFAPGFGPWLISRFGLGESLYHIDCDLRRRKWSNGGGMKMLLAQKILRNK
jgi:SAM-dependent methyltransferase